MKSYFRESFIAEAIQYLLENHVSRYDVFKKILSLYIINIYDIFNEIWALNIARYFLPRDRIFLEISFSLAVNIVRRRNFTGTPERTPESGNNVKNKNGSKTSQYFYAHRSCCCSSRSVNLRRTSSQYSRVYITRRVIPSLLLKFWIHSYADFWHMSARNCVLLVIEFVFHSADRSVRTTYFQTRLPLFFFSITIYWLYFRKYCWKW